MSKQILFQRSILSNHPYSLTLMMIPLLGTCFVCKKRTSGDTIVREKTISVAEISSIMASWQKRAVANKTLGTCKIMPNRKWPALPRQESVHGEDILFHFCKFLLCWFTHRKWAMLFSDTFTPGLQPLECKTKLNTR